MLEILSCHFQHLYTEKEYLEFFYISYIFDISSVLHMMYTVKNVTILFALCSLASLLSAPLPHPPLIRAPLPLTLTLHLSSTAVHLQWPRSDFCAITSFSVM